MLDANHHLRAELKWLAAKKASFNMLGSRHASLKDVLYETTRTPFGLCTVNADAHLSCRKPEKREQSGRLGE
jgi:hypothetical protein